MARDSELDLIDLEGMTVGDLQALVDKVPVSKYMPSPSTRVILMDHGFKPGVRLRRVKEGDELWHLDMRLQHGKTSAGARSVVSHGMYFSKSMAEPPVQESIDSAWLAQLESANSILFGDGEDDEAHEDDEGNPHVDVTPRADEDLDDDG